MDGLPPRERTTNLDGGDPGATRRRDGGDVADSTSSVAESIRRAQDGDRDALDRLLARYRAYLRVLAAACIHRSVQRKADASDVVQEALLRASERFAQFRGTTENEWLAWL